MALCITITYSELKAFQAQHWAALALTLQKPMIFRWRAEFLKAKYLACLVPIKLSTRAPHLNKKWMFLLQRFQHLAAESQPHQGQQALHQWSLFIMRNAAPLLIATAILLAILHQRAAQ